MTYFLKSGSKFNVSTKDALDLHESLPVGTYTLKYDAMGEFFYLERVEDFTISHKLYGDTRAVTQRVLNTFASRPNQTGVMLSGEKGSGKTLQAKDISIEAGKIGIPTVVINDEFSGDDFNTFMQKIEQPLVVIFDEFEKVYERDAQEKLLTLFDGVYPSNRLFIITANDRWKVNSHMQNRPGRIYYFLDYSGLSSEFIIEYCEDNLKDKSHIETICKISTLFGEFNFDILQSLVAEMNLYDESPQEAMKFLNAKPENSSDVTYDVELEHNGQEIAYSDLYQKTWNGNPLSGEIETQYKKRKDKDNWSWTEVLFDSSHFVQADGKEGKFLFVNTDEKARLTLTRRRPQVFNYNAF